MYSSAFANMFSYKKHNTTMEPDGYKNCTRSFFHLSNSNYYSEILSRAALNFGNIKLSQPPLIIYLMGHGPKVCGTGVN